MNGIASEIEKNTVLKPSYVKLLNKSGKVGRWEPQRKIYLSKVQNTQSKRYITHSQYTYQLMYGAFFQQQSIECVHLTSMVFGIRNMSPLYYVRLTIDFSFWANRWFSYSVFVVNHRLIFHIQMMCDSNQFTFFVMIQSIFFAFIRQVFLFHLEKIYSFIFAQISWNGRSSFYWNHL